MRWFSPVAHRDTEYAAVAILDPAGELSSQPELEEGGFRKVPGYLLNELQERLGQALNGCAAYLGQLSLSRYCEPSLV
jgi:hypothetical protein